MEYAVNAQERQAHADVTALAPYFNPRPPAGDWQGELGAGGLGLGHKNQDCPGITIHRNTVNARERSRKGVGQKCSPLSTSSTNATTL
jgi:hypothetical protein